MLLSAYHSARYDYSLVSVVMGFATAALLMLGGFLLLLLLIGVKAIRPY